MRPSVTGMKVRALCCTSAVLIATSAVADNGRALRSAEQAFFDRMANDFSALLPPVPGGWNEMERVIHDPLGTAPYDADRTPFEAQYRWRIESLDRAQRQGASVMVGLAEAGSPAQQEEARRNLEIMQKHYGKLAANPGKPPLPEELLKAGEAVDRELKPTTQIGVRPDDRNEARFKGIRDTYAEIRVRINPPEEPRMPSSKNIPVPSGFFRAVHVPRQSDDGPTLEPVTQLVFGQWTEWRDGYSKWIPVRGQSTAGVHAAIIEIEGTPERIEALLSGINLDRVRAWGAASPQKK